MVARGNEGERKGTNGSEGKRRGVRGRAGATKVRGAHGRRAGDGTRGARTGPGRCYSATLPDGRFRQAPSGGPLRAGTFRRALSGGPFDGCPQTENRPLRRRAHKVGAAAEGGCPGYPRISCGRTSAASGGRPVLRSRAPCPGLPLAASAPSSPEQCCVRGRRCGHRGSADSASCPRSCLLLRISDDGPSPDSHVGKKGAFRVRVAECDSPRPRPAPARPSGACAHSHGAAVAGEGGPYAGRDQAGAARALSVAGTAEIRRGHVKSSVGRYGLGRPAGLLMGTGERMVWRGARCSRPWSCGDSGRCRASPAPFPVSPRATGEGQATA